MVGMIKNGYGHSGHEIIRLTVSKECIKEFWLEGKMFMNIEIMDSWESESRLIAHFCWFFQPLVYRKGP